MHSFDPNIAQQVGVNAAVIYQNIVWWCQKNAANGHNEREGRHWTYNSLSAWAQLFPYMTAKQIRTALEKLEEEGLIVTGFFNDQSFDRTKWYSPADAPDLPSKANADVHLPSGANPICPTGQIPSAPQGKCLTDNKPEITPVDKHTPPTPRDAGGAVGGSSASQELVLGSGFDLDASEAPKREKAAGGLREGCRTLDDEFERVWEHYPRKVGKGAARKAWAKARRQATYAEITGPLGVWIKLQRGTPVEKIPHFTTWLNQERWHDDQTHARNRAETTTDRLNRLGAVSTEDQSDAIAGPRRKPPQIELRMDP